MVITVGNQKGGVGKTTIATNLACLFAQNHKVLLIDADTQQSSADFHAIRLENDSLPQFTCVSITKPTIHKDIKNFTDFDPIIIDVGGRDNAVFRSSILAADHLIIPVTPSQYDVWATEETFNVLEEARIVKDSVAHVLFNQVIPNTKIAKEVHNVLQEKSEQYNLTIMQSILCSRIAFKEAVSSGISVVEKTKNSKAGKEMKEVFEEVNIAILQYCNIYNS